MFRPDIRTRVALATLLAAGAPHAAAAQTDFYNTDAGRPITIEDAVPIERRALELQLAPLRLSRARGGVYQWGIEPEVAIGVLPRTQLEFGAPFAYVDAGAGRRASGLAGIDVSLLHALNVETSIPALAVAADVLLPVGALAPARAYPSVTGLVTRTFSRARLHVNGRWTVGDRLPADVATTGAELSRWQAGAALDRTFPLRSLLVTGELFARQPLRTGADVEWNTGGGVRYQLGPRLAGDAGAGYRLTGDDRGWFATVGAAVALGLPWRAR